MFAVISIPDVERVILHELSTSPSPKSRKVGVPPKVRPGMTIPKKSRDRHVYIFDSQPFPSPTSSQNSPVSGGGHTSRLRMSQIAESASSMANELVSAPNSVASSIASMSLLSSTPPTSFGSVMSKSALEMAAAGDASTAGADGATDKGVPSSLLITTKEVPPQPKGPSLLSQTAPPDLCRPCTSSEATSSEATSLAASREASPHPSRSPIPLPPPIQVKIADLGNATPVRVHFTEDIQTRQYRSPEAILGRSDWDATVDVWSVACVVFELLTAEYLFDPQAQGEIFRKDDDHMAQIIELLGDFALDFKTHGRYARDLFDSQGNLRYIRSLKPWPLLRVMVEKYLFTEADAKSLCEFLSPMLTVDFRARATAGDMVDHPWLDCVDEQEDGELL